MRSEVISERIVVSLDDILSFSSRMVYLAFAERDVDQKEIPTQVLLDIVRKGVDEILTRNMYWTKQFRSYESSDISNLLIDSIPRLPLSSAKYIGYEIYNRISTKLLEWLELPTWKVIHVSFEGTYCLFEIDEDYRIKQWEEEHGGEYPARLTSLGRNKDLAVRLGKVILDAKN